MAHKRNKYGNNASKTLLEAFSRAAGEGADDS